MWGLTHVQWQGVGLRLGRWVEDSMPDSVCFDNVFWYEMGKAYASCPAASRLTSGWAARIQKRSCSRRKVCTPVRLAMSHTRMLLSSELDTMISCDAPKIHESIVLMVRVGQPSPWPLTGLNLLYMVYNPGQ